MEYIFREFAGYYFSLAKLFTQIIQKHIVEKSDRFVIIRKLAYTLWTPTPHTNLPNGAMYYNFSKDTDCT